MAHILLKIYKQNVIACGFQVTIKSGLFIMKLITS